MMRYVKFAKSTGLAPFPLTENVLYAFMDQYCRSAAATFGRSFLESLNFAVHVLGLDLSVNISGRVQGVAKARYLEKRKVVQKPALTVLHVKTLEKIVLGGTSAEYGGTSAEYGEFDRHCAGFFCYALYSRARFSDAQASANLTLDATEGDDGLYGFLEASVTRSKTSYTLERKTRFLPMVAPINGLFLEASVTRSKTSYTLERKTRFLPMVAPINGLLDEPWGVRWHRIMLELGVVLREGYPLLSAPTTGGGFSLLPHRIMLELGVVLREGYPLLSAPTTGGGFSLLPMTAEYAARVLRELLRRELGDSAEIRKLGTHSLKRTLLSWLAKYGTEQGVLEKRKVVQKPALTVLHVKTLEKIVLGGTSVEYSEFDRHCLSQSYAGCD
eukprot:s10619_g2.t1